MSISIYKTRAMLKALNMNRAEKFFLLDTLFRTVETFDTETVDIDIIKGDERLAPFVSPRVEGKLVEEQGFSTRSYKPGYVKPKYIIPAVDLINDRSPGQNIYEGSASQRSADRLAKNLQDGQKQIQRREEWMASQGLVTGKVDVVGDGINYQIDFGMSPSHLVTLTGTDKWSDSASTPLLDIRKWARTISEDGYVNADIIVGGSEAIDALLKNEEVYKYLDNRRILVGGIDPKNLAPGVTYFGTITATGINVDIYEYNGSYIDDAGVRQYFIPKDRIVMTSTQADFRRNFGAIADFDAGLQPLAVYPKSWMTEDPSARTVLLQSAPLPAPHQIDAIISAKVV